MIENEKKVHLDLFSGIGGFALAADRVFGNVEHVFCEIEPFAQEVLKKHWPSAPIVSDIRNFTINPFGDKHRAERRTLRETQEIQAIRGAALDARGFGGTTGTFLLTGGFPCQPFSQAGRRKGTADDRHLWPEMLRVIREFRPTWVIGENVAGFTTMVQHESSPQMDSQGHAIGEVGDTHHRVGRFVASEALEALEAEGYEVQAFVIPAVAVNAPHRRDRVWIVANSKHERAGNAQRRRNDERASTRTARPNTDAPDSSRKQTNTAKQTRLHPESACESWRENWLEVAARLCRMDDGVPRRMDRNPRLKALGNAIVPQVAEEIMRVIKTI